MVCLRAVVGPLFREGVDRTSRESGSSSGRKEVVEQLLKVGRGQKLYVVDTSILWILQLPRDIAMIDEFLPRILGVFPKNARRPATSNLTTSTESRPG